MRVFQNLLAFSGNAPPQLAVTHELVARGHQVQVLAHEAARQRIEHTGADFQPFRRSYPDCDLTRPEADPVRDWEARTSLGASKRLRDRGIIAPLADATEDCAEALADFQPDVVVFDCLLPGMGVAAEAAGVPAVALVHFPFPVPVDGAPPTGFGVRPMAGPVGRLRDRGLARLNHRFFDVGLPTLNQVRGRHGLPPLGHFHAQLLAAAAVCVMTAPELDFASRGALPENVHFVGPAFEPFAETWDSLWPDSNQDPLIVIGLSSSYMAQSELAQRILDAAGGLPVRALFTAGPAIDTSGLRLPENARAVNFIPHRAVFPHASLVVTHAGWQTVNASLADGVPLVCIPDGRDQPDNAARVVEAGAGIRVPKRIPPDKLRRIIEAALHDAAIHEAARTIAEAQSRSNGAHATAERIEELGGLAQPATSRAVPAAAGVKSERA